MTDFEKRYANMYLRNWILDFNEYLRKEIFNKELRMPRLFMAERTAAYRFRKQATEMYLAWKDNNPIAAQAIRDKHIHFERRSSDGFSGYVATRMFR